MTKSPPQLRWAFAVRLLLNFRKGAAEGGAGVGTEIFDMNGAGGAATAAVVVDAV